MLEEAGFEVPCRGIYHVSRQGENTLHIYDRKSDLMGLSRDSRDNFQYEYLAPTQSIAARWLREVHHFAVCIWFSKDHEKWFYAYGDMQNITFDTDYDISEYEYETYEAALESGLQVALELIVKNKE